MMAHPRRSGFDLKLSWAVRIQRRWLGLSPADNHENHLLELPWAWEPADSSFSSTFVEEGSAYSGVPDGNQT